MSPLLWWSASIFFLGGSFHQLMSPLDPLTVVWFAILPFLLIISWISASLKPTADEAAAAADRLFGANSLFVSAWELSRSSATIEGISRLLLVRTETELPGWSLHFRKQPQRYMKPTSLVATSLGIVGLFFLLQPPHVQTSDIPATTPFSQRKPLNQSKDPAVVLSELFKEKTATATAAEQYLQQNSPFDSSKGADSQKTPPSRQAVTAEISKDGSQMTKQMSGKPSIPDEKLPPEQNVLLTSSTPGEGKKIAEQTAGNETADSTDKMINKAEKFDRVSLIDIETGTDNQTTAFDGTREGEKLIVSAPAQATFLQPASDH